MNELAQVVGISVETQTKLLSTLLVLALFWFIHRFVVALVLRRVEDLRLRYSWRKSSGYLLAALAILWIGQVWFAGFRNVATFLGLLSAGLAIALRDLIIDFLGWVFILTNRPFRVGDRIQIGGTAGDVIDLRLFSFTLLEIGNWVDADQSTGRVVHIPNGKVFSESVANYESGFQFIWNEIPFHLTLDSDWKAAKEILQEIACNHAGNSGESAKQRVQAASQKFLIYYSNLTPTVYTSLKDGSIKLTIRYLCEPRQRRTTAEAIYEDALQALNDRPDIHLTGN